MSARSLPQPRIALVYDWLDTSLGGAEKVLQALSELYPQAPVYTAYMTTTVPSWVKKEKVKTSFLQRMPRLWSHKSLLTELLTYAFESFDFQDYDVIISVSSFAAKGILTKPHQLHLCYLLTPTRFLFSHADSYLQSGWMKWPILKHIVAHQKSKLQRWDKIAAYRPDHIIPISQLIAHRTMNYYHIKPLTPLYPPVDLSSLRQTATQNLIVKHVPSGFPFFGQDFFLIIARQVAYKRVDLAIQAAVKMKKKLVVAGTGPLAETLRNLAIQLDPHHRYIFFAGAVSLSDLVYYYQYAQALLMPGEEDFGITGLEAQAFGLPLLINAKSGVAETIIDQESGYYLSTESVTALERGFAWLEQNRTLLHKSRPRIAKNALEYDTGQFKKKFSHLVSSLWLTHNKESKDETKYLR